MEYEDLIYNVEEGIATMTLNRPQKLNSFTPKMLQGILAVVEEVTADEKVRVLVITGAGRAFCTGADVRLLEQDSSRHRTGLAVAGIYSLPVRLRQMDKPV